MKNMKSSRYSFVKNRNMEKIQRAIDMLAYGSLFLDVCIALITALSLLNITTGEFIMIPIHYLLTIVVILSLISGGMLVYLRHYEKIREEITRMKYKMKIPKPSERSKYSMKWKFDRLKEKYVKNIFVSK